MDKLNINIKDVLNDEVKDLCPSEDILFRIKKDIEARSLNKRKNYHVIEVKKQISVAVGVFIIIAILVFSTSNEVRTFAYDMLESVKTIFVLENSSIKEKSSDEPFLTSSACNRTDKSDEELSELVGFKVFFPITLANSFQLEAKNINVSLNKLISYNESLIIGEKVGAAITDDNAFEELKAYEPERGVSANYKNSKKSFSISVSPASKVYKLDERIPNDFQKVDLDGFFAYWRKGSTPLYPQTDLNDISMTDMTQKPKTTKCITLLWEKEGKTYSLNSFSDSLLSLEEAMSITKEFMSAN